MAKKKKIKSKVSEVNEPIAFYGVPSLHIFKSAEEQEEFELIQMANRTPEESLNKLEAMRRFFFKEYLLPNGKWPPVKRIITFREPFK